MDSKLVLVKIITLLYCEGISKRVSHRSVSLAQDIVSRLKLPEQVTETDSGRNVIVGLRETVMWMCDQPEDEPYDFNALLQRVRLNAGDDFTVFQAFEDVDRYHAVDDDTMMKLCNGLHGELKGFLHQWAIREIIHKAHRELFYNKKPLDWRKYTENLVADLEAYSNGWAKGQESFVLNLMKMSDPESLMKVLEKAKEDTEGAGGFRSGWAAFNRMLGESCQMRRGMFVLVGGLTHCYKSGLVHDLFRHACIHNDPIQEDADKKPTILYFSSENRAEEDLTRMYVALKENETGLVVDISQIDKVEAAAYVAEKLTARGWNVDMIRINPNEFTYQELYNIVLKYEAEGCEVHAIYFDYLALINRRGCQSSMIGEDIRLLMQRVRTFMSSRNILFITPHQLSQEAMALKRAGVGNFVAEIAGKNYWDASKRIANEADLEVYVDIVERDKRHYLAIHRGKHRTVKATPLKYRSFYIPFQEAGYVPDDLHTTDSSLQSLTTAEAGMEIDFT